MNVPADIRVEYKDERGNTIIRVTRFRAATDRDNDTPRLVYDPRATTFAELDYSWPLAED